MADAARSPRRLPIERDSACQFTIVFTQADLPSEVEALRPLVLEHARELDALQVFQAEDERLKASIEAQHAVDKASKASVDRPHKANRGSLTAHLERIEQVVEV